MEQIRAPAVSGMFYPAEPQALRQLVQQYISSAQSEAIFPKALVSPHAGYIYSGIVAGTAYAYLKNVAATVRRVLLLGPAHRAAFSGLALSNASKFETPLGLIPLDKEAAERLSALPFVCRFDEAHAEEHSLEVQLPFLQEVLPDFNLLPLVVGDASAEQICAVIQAFNPGTDSVVIVSSDLSHYLSYERAIKLDAATAKSIEELDHKSLHPECACGVYPLRGLLLYAKNSAWRAIAVHLANSGDTAGSRERVVGYGAFVFY